MEKLELILFDFGGVLYNIDHLRTVKAFAELSKRPEYIMKKELSKFYLDNIFLDFEKGIISKEVFRDKVRERYDIVANDDEFDAAWNSTLIGPIDNALEILSKIKEKFRLALLSNTNEIHCEKFSSQCKELLSYFEKQFYSFKMKSRKPEEKIFKDTIKELDLLPKSILFVDDSFDNIETANKLGFNTHHIIGNEINKLVQKILEL